MLTKKIWHLPLHMWILLFVMVIGIFLRTYHFHDWLIFNPDQARDAMVVSSALSGKTNLPLLGPIAGGTNFHLGAIFYSFEYVSAWIFGDSPDSMAYPDLLFSILTLFLFFSLLKEYFSQESALILTAIASTSYFMVVNARFASNPNSIPFFLTLFFLGLLGIIEDRDRVKYRWLWPSLVGIGVGVGIQLHTLLLLSLPFVSIVVFMWKRKLISWKNVFFIVCLVLFINVGQIQSEFVTGGANTREFITSVTKNTQAENSFFRKIGTTIGCQIQSNASILTPLGYPDDCNRLFSTKGGIPIISIVVSVAFSIGGYLLLIYYLRREQDEKKRVFLSLFVLYQGVTFLIMIPVIDQLSTRYYIVLFFVPFILLGLWFDAIFSFARKYATTVIFLLAIALVGNNVFALYVDAKVYSLEQMNDQENSILGETELMASYILEKSDQSQERIILSGKKMYAKRFFKSFQYLLGQSGKELVLADKMIESLTDGEQLFYVAKTSDKHYVVGDAYEGRRIEDIRKFSKVMIVVLK